MRISLESHYLLLSFILMNKNDNNPASEMILTGVQATNANKKLYLAADITKENDQGNKNVVLKDEKGQLVKQDKEGQKEDDSDASSDDDDEPEWFGGRPRARVAAPITGNKPKPVQQPQPQTR